MIAMMTVVPKSGCKTIKPVRPPCHSEWNQEPLAKIPDAVDFIRQIMGEEEDQGDLDHFGNLEGEDSEV